MIGSALIVVLVLAKFNFNLSDLLGAAADNSGKGEAFLQPGLQYGATLTSQDRLPVPRPRARARHRRPAAHPDPLLHRADRAGRAEVGAVGDRPDRRLLPDDAGPRLRCRGPARPRPGGPARGRQPEPRRPRCWPRPSVAARARRAARCCWRSSRRSPSRRSSRWSPGSRWPARPRWRTTSTRASSRRTSPSSEDDEVRVARIAAFVIGAIAIAAVDPGAAPQHRVPGGAGLRGRRVGQPAGDHLQHVLAALQHPRRHLEHLRRPHLGRRPGAASRRSMSGLPTSLFPDSDWSIFPLNNPGIVSIPLGLPARLHRHDHARRSRTPRTATPSSRSAPSPAPAPSRPSQH